ncbi:MAG TPA: redoxin family protein [Candidatus Dormibacteraeota bacterium]|nr:redoxin family protein [Candidatus Dormibacteraeota bacterium]
MAPKLQPATGTLVVIAAGRSATTLPAASLMLGQGGSWSAVGTVAGDVPAAPEQRQLLEVAVPVGTYQGVRVGDAIEPVTVVITAGQVEPLLLGIEGGKPIPGAAYAGNDDVNLGLGELAGKFVAMPSFSLTDQAGRPFTLDSVVGKDVVIAAFHTTCHETCPLYTALFLQLARQQRSSVELVEVTTDPGTDTPSLLAAYAKQAGASWTFATGTPDQVSAFWKPFGVELATGDTHTSTLALLDRHGYVRLVYRGVPKVGGDIPPALVSTLSAKGLVELASGGDGWGAPDVLQALSTISRGEPSPAAAGGAAPDFALPSTDGATVRLADLRGRPLAINFWGTYCPPCRAEMPLLREAVPRAGVRLVLINEGESADTVRAFLARIGVDQPSLLDPDLAVGRAYAMSALPMTIFVRSDGTVDRRQIGQLDERVLASELSILASQ